VSTPPPVQCAVCKKDPARRNNTLAECSHVECPHRSSSWFDAIPDALEDDDDFDPLDGMFDSLKGEKDE